MATATLQAVHKGILALGLCASMAAGSLGFVGHAEARLPEGDRMTASAQVCGAIQDLWDAAKARRSATHDNAEWTKVDREMDELEKQWRNAGCGEYYGTISARVGAPVRRTFTLKAEETGLDVQPTEEPTPNNALQPVGKLTNRLAH